MASFCFAWWIFHIISNPFNCSDTAKGVAKAMIGVKEITRLCFAIYFCFCFSNFAPKLVPRIFGLFSSRKPGWIFPYEPKAKFVLVSGPARLTGLIRRGLKCWLLAQVSRDIIFFSICENFLDLERFLDWEAFPIHESYLWIYESNQDLKLISLFDKLFKSDLSKRYPF